MVMGPVETGMVLGERYRLERVLGHGGMADVWRATDVILQRPVAVKVLSAHVARDPALRSRFTNESRSAARLNHPNVVAVYDASDGSVDGAIPPFIILELVEGETLSELLRRREQLPLPEVLSIAADVATGLDHAHTLGIVHSDVKPENVLIGAHGRAKLADFGLARLAATSVTGPLYATPLYLAPERWRGAPASAASDVYALGATIFHALIGRPPFAGDTTAALAYQHEHAAIPSARALRPDVPAALDDLIQRALAKDPRMRPVDAADVVGAIAGLTAGAPTVRVGAPDGGVTQPLPRRLPIAADSGLRATPSGPPRVAPAAARRRPGRGWPAALMGALLGLVLLAVLGQWLGTLVSTATAPPARVVPSPTSASRALVAAKPTSPPAVAPATKPAPTATAVPARPTATLVAPTPTPPPPTRVAPTPTPPPVAAPVVAQIRDLRDRLASLDVKDDDNGGRGKAKGKKNDDDDNEAATLAQRADQLLEKVAEGKREDAIKITIELARRIEELQRDRRLDPATAIDLLRRLASISTSL